MQSNLFDQLATCPADLSLVATVCNTHTAHPGFRIALREIPAFPGRFTIGDAAAAYFEHMRASIERAEEERRCYEECRAEAGPRRYEALPHPAETDYPIY